LETDQLQVHHKSYKNLYKKGEIRDLEFVCRGCHEMIHDKVEYDPELLAMIDHALEVLKK
jgi:predicted HNH restriction endonuclease